MVQHAPGDLSVPTDVVRESLKRNIDISENPAEFALQERHSVSVVSERYVAP